MRVLPSIERVELASVVLLYLAAFWADPEKWLIQLRHFNENLSENHEIVQIELRNLNSCTLC